MEESRRPAGAGRSARTGTRWKKTLMLKHTLIATFLLLGLAPAHAADESDVVGTWAVDTAALRSQMESMMEAQLAQLPESQRGPAMAMVQGQLDQMVGQMEGQAEFRPDGTVTFTSATDPATYGTWSIENDRLRFGRAQPVAGEPAYVGSVDGDVIEVRPEGGEPDPSFTVTLRRQD